MLGPFIYSSSLFALQNGSPHFVTAMFTKFKLIKLIAQESALLAVMFTYLHWRGWTPADFKIRIDWQGTLVMPLLVVAAVFANLVTALSLKLWVVWMAPHPQGFLAALLAGSPHIPRHSIEIAWLAIVVSSIVNAYLEELVFMGYAFNQFAAKRGPFFALMCMVFLRMALHTYKGPLDMLGIAAFSMVYGLAYQYLGRLWPLILGHACVDLMAFSMLKIIFGR